MATVSGRVRSVEVKDKRTTVVVETGAQSTTTVFVDDTAYSGAAGYDGEIAVAKKEALLLAAAWGVPVQIDVDAASVVNYIILQKV